MKGPIRLHAPFAAWSKAVDQGTAPELRQWLEQVSDQLWDRLRPGYSDLLLHGHAAWGTDGEGNVQSVEIEETCIAASES